MTHVAPLSVAVAPPPGPSWWKKYLPAIIGAVLGASCPLWPPSFRPVCTAVAQVAKSIDLTGLDSSPALPVVEPTPYPPAPEGREP